MKLMQLVGYLTSSLTGVFAVLGIANGSVPLGFVAVALAIVTTYAFTMQIAHRVNAHSAQIAVLMEYKNRMSGMSAGRKK